tara:strand:- start:52 stop:423 length:372 start_codon:yes stop_codon:yes gene_type:complete
MKILFVCVGNSCRSQMAEAIAKKMGHEAFSAGTNPASEVNYNAIKVLKKMGIDTSKLFPKSIDKFLEESFDMIISMGCGVFCPSIRIDQDWKLEDPVGKKLKFFEEIAITIKENIKLFNEIKQ